MASTVAEATVSPIRYEPAALLLVFWMMAREAIGPPAMAPTNRRPSSSAEAKESSAGVRLTSPPSVNRFL